MMMSWAQKICSHAYFTVSEDALLCAQGNSFDLTNHMSPSQFEFTESVEDRGLYLSGAAPVKHFIHTEDR